MLDLRIISWLALHHRQEGIRISCLNHVVAVPLVEIFFAERSINVWNFLPSSVNFSSLATFRRSIQDIDFTDFLKCGLYLLIYGYVCYFTYFS